MQATAHPDYAEEHTQLDKTLSYVHNEQTRYTPNIAYGGNKYTQRTLITMNAQQLDQLKEALQQPYFGRVDLEEDAYTGRERFYIGKIALPGAKVYSWADNMVADLYYKQHSERTAGKLLLKRTLEIADAKLHDIRDEFVDQSIAAIFDHLTDEYTDTLLLKLLRENRRGKLHDIVATIQEQQYRIISSPIDRLLVIQGAPGSGKTSVALHRIAYLLYNHRDRLTANNMLVLGPNQMFLGYIANILPTLGERQIPHRTFDAWLLEQLDTSELIYEAQDTSLEDLLDPTQPLADKIMQYRNAQTKGSLKMAMLLDRYVALLHEDVLADKQPLVCTVSAHRNRRRTASVTRSLDQLRSELDTTKNLPFNQRRAAFEQRLVRDISRELFVTLVSELRNGQASEKEIEEEAQKQIHAYFEDWRGQNVSVSYRRLLRTPEILRRAGSGVFDEWDLELLTQDAPTALTPFRFSDLAALLYLKLRLDGRNGKTYDHIVIDEAQDITPLHFRVLYEYSRSASMTVLGDLSQSIYSHHGIGDWQELVPAVGGEAMDLEQIQQSYRSTDAIVAYGNALITRSGFPLDRQAQHIGRSGEAPTLHHCTDMASIAVTIIHLVGAEQAAGHTSIAVVCKTIAGCRVLQTALMKSGFSAHQVIDRRDLTYRGGIALFPAYLTKGLEFDSVIIADADATTYAPDDINARLLYVAVTRASHTLHVCWLGSLTPLLDQTLLNVDHQPLFDGHLIREATTINAYAVQNSPIDSDWCVERLAAADKLHLLRNGQIDPIVLEIVLRGIGVDQHRASSETVLQPLNKAARQALREYMLILQMDRDPRVEGALAVTQLAYGLLRNQIRAAGLEPLDDADSDVTGQVALMLPLLQAVQEQEVTLSAGRWTTQQRAIQAVDSSRRMLAQELLAMLLDYGIVEATKQGSRTQVRVPQQWVQGLLALGLGHRPDAWDKDVLAHIPALPEPLRIEMLVEVV